MNPVDQRILTLLDDLKNRGVIKYDVEFCREVGILRQNLINIRKGNSRFRVDHIQKIVKKYQVNANWILGVSEEMFIEKNRVEV